MDGPFCHCGRRGCIESFVGDYALYRDARAMLDLPNTDALHPSEEQMQVLCDLAAKGDPVALGLFEQAGRALGFGLTNLIALISPSLILVSGSGVRAYQYLEPSMQRSLKDGLVETTAGQHRDPAPALGRRPDASRHHRAGASQRPLPTQLDQPSQAPRAADKTECGV